ncbi:OmpA family protein [Megasphaera massiliensis]|uniref:OmpA family protein n=1 Tax=Megasphaera massiliensis TaxID=1232428 RepID=UPI0005C9F768|nr:OmpA family protein [Megasphaera massiliensis]MBS6255899.1 OmpA family protein [Megasphaera sp.]MCQ5211072.1 OmpA family protein [Megasphaera massiliensis]MEE0658339.1 OmpA family protein [Megasphaera massiliensis]
MRKRENDETSIWISNTDLMSGLLVLFLFIAILMNQGLSEAQDEIKKITGASNEVRRELQESIKQNFSAEEIKRYNLDQENNVGAASFDKGDGRFLVGSSELTPEFRATLQVFLPKYIKSISDIYEKDPDKIKEIRIEGHTSTEWFANNNGQLVTANDAYIKNMELSQNRTRAIIQFALSLPELVPYHSLIKEKLTANGLSSSQIIKKEDGSEDFDASRRIEFKVVVNDEATVKAIEENIL